MNGYEPSRPPFGDRVYVDWRNPERCALRWRDGGEMRGWSPPHEVDRESYGRLATAWTNRAMLAPLQVDPGVWTLRWYVDTGTEPTPLLAPLMLDERIDGSGRHDPGAWMRGFTDAFNRGLVDAILEAEADEAAAAAAGEMFWASTLFTLHGGVRLVGLDPRVVLQTPDGTPLLIETEHIKPNDDEATLRIPWSAVVTMEENN